MAAKKLGMSDNGLAGSVSIYWLLSHVRAGSRPSANRLFGGASGTDGSLGGVVQKAALRLGQERASGRAPEADAAGHRRAAASSRGAEKDPANRLRTRGAEEAMPAGGALQASA